MRVGKRWAPARGDLGGGISWWCGVGISWWWLRSQLIAVKIWNGEWKWHVTGYFQTYIYIYTVAAYPATFPGRPQHYCEQRYYAICRYALLHYVLASAVAISCHKISRPIVSCGTGTIRPRTLCPHTFNFRMIRLRTLYPGVFTSP
jgi:hypothetical protein